jgi:aspartate/methionine/tyrosine aminotransferase
MVKFNLGWGNSVAVREAFLNTYQGNMIVFSYDRLMNMDYPTHEGDPALVELTKQVVKRQTGQDYKHLFLVNGATGGVVIALRAYAQQGYEFAMTRKAPFYVRYPKMVEASGLKHIEFTHRYPILKTCFLLDLPSNPLGLQDELAIPGAPQILDGVYYNNVYMPWRPISLPMHKTMIGSYSKLLGINGIRVGWLATNDDELAVQYAQLVTSEYCGLSQASTDILKIALHGYDWDLFEQSARFKLDCNREEFSKLEKYFGDTPVRDVGMFFYGPMDSTAQALFTKAGISWTPGSSMGTNDSFARFNLGQSNAVIRDAVAAVLKADRT